MGDDDDFYCSDHSASKTLSEDTEIKPKPDPEEHESDWEEVQGGKHFISTVVEVLYNACIEDAFINMSADTIAADEKKDAAKKKRREREKRKRDEKKAAAPAKRLSTSKARSKPTQDNGGDSDDSFNSNAAKKQKQDATEQKVTVYIHVQSLAPPPRQVSNSRSKGKADPVPVAIRGPCFFQLDQTYDDFKGIIARELPCKLRLLPTAQVTWKYEKPANDPKKPLLNNAGYEAMVISLAERKSNHVIVISMPPPKADDTVS